MITNADLEERDLRLNARRDRREREGRIARGRPTGYARSVPSLPRRLGLTLAAIGTFLLAGEYLRLPGVRLGALVPFGKGYLAGVLALGVMPVLSAYVLVEIAAYLVPAWSRLRHENPGGRAKLDLAVGWLAAALSLLQGLGVALALESGPAGLGDVVTEPGWGFRVTVTLTLAAGVAVSVLIARAITAQGLANGLVMLAAAQALRVLVGGVAHAPADGRQWVVAALAIGVVAYATLRAIAAAEAPPVAVTDDGSPYRGARSLLARPVVPVPTGSIVAYSAALALAGAWSSLRVLDIPAPPLPAGLVARLAVVVVLASALNVAFGWAMHRPAEFRRLARRLAAQPGEEARAAVRRTYLPSVLFFVVLALASRALYLATGSSLVFVPFLVAATLDLTRSARLRRGGAAWVTVWEDRRVTAAHAIRAVLECQGIDARAEGMGVLSLLQAFAPFAPARIVVPAAEHDAAMNLLGRLLPGGARLKEPASPEELRAPRATRPRPVVIPLAVCAAAALFVAGVAGYSPGGHARRAALEIVRIDDDTNVLSDARPSDGVELLHESLPGDDGATRIVAYATVDRRAGEDEAAARARLERWLAEVPIPAGHRFGVARTSETTPQGRETMTGWRSYLLTGKPLITTADVQDAVAPLDAGGSASVLVTLSPAAADRFEQATGDWIDRRMAILLDGQVMVAPVVRSRIAGGQLSISLGVGDPDALGRQARTLAASLRP